MKTIHRYIQAFHAPDGTLPNIELEANCIRANAELARVSQSDYEIFVFGRHSHTLLATYQLLSLFTKVHYYADSEVDAMIEGLNRRIFWAWPKLMALVLMLPSATPFVMLDIDTFLLELIPVSTTSAFTAICTEPAEWECYSGPRHEVRLKLLALELEISAESVIQFSVSHQPVNCGLVAYHDSRFAAKYAMLAIQFMHAWSHTAPEPQPMRTEDGKGVCFFAEMMFAEQAILGMCPGLLKVKGDTYLDPSPAALCHLSNEFLHWWRIKYHIKNLPAARIEALALMASTQTLAVSAARHNHAFAQLVKVLILIQAALIQAAK